MEKNILIDKIRALTKENSELRKLQDEGVEASRDKREVKPESTEKILKATARNQREAEPEINQRLAIRERHLVHRMSSLSPLSDQTAKRATRRMEKIKCAMEPECNISTREERVDKDLVAIGRRWLYVVKGLHGWMMSRAKKVKVQSFPGATSGDMDHYLQPIISRSPDHVILHIGTNDLSSSKP